MRAARAKDRKTRGAASAHASEGRERDAGYLQLRGTIYRSCPAGLSRHERLATILGPFGARARAQSVRFSGNGGISPKDRGLVWFDRKCRIYNIVFAALGFCDHAEVWIREARDRLAGALGELEGCTD